MDAPRVVRGSRRLRIALITPGFSAGESDWCIPALLNLVRELAQRHDVHVFALRYPHRRDVYDVYGATVHAFGGATISGVRRLSLLAAVLASIVRLARRRRFDIVHGFWADEPGALAVIAGRLLGIPAVVSLMGGELVGYQDIGYGGQVSVINRRLIDVALRHATYVTVGSHLLRRLTREHVDANRLAVMPLGVDTDRFAPPPASGNRRRRLLHVASLVPVKAQEVLLRAVAGLPDVALDIVGDGPRRGALERLAASLGVSSRVVFHGEVAHERLPSFYRTGALFVLSSRYESQNLAVIEAAACGMPAVGTAVGILPELGDAACTVAVGDDAALSAAIRTVLADERCRRRMGCAARRRVECTYALHRTIDALCSLYGVLSLRLCHFAALR